MKISKNVKIALALFGGYLVFRYWPKVTAMVTTTPATNQNPPIANNPVP